jgi:hypothetical protein
MCLRVVSRELPKKLIKPNGRITVYKVLDLTEAGNLHTPYQFYQVKVGKWFKAKGRTIFNQERVWVPTTWHWNGSVLTPGYYQYTSNYDLHGGAIHAYIKRPKLKHDFIVKCEALPKDFIAIGVNDIAFKKIYISKRAVKEAWEKYGKFYSHCRRPY